MTDAVHTSAHDEPDMFGGATVDPTPGAQTFELVGVLIRAAEVRTKVVGHDERSMPVLCMDVRPVSGLHRTIHAEHIYTEATRKDAERKAATLKKGARITLTTTLTDMRTILPHVQAVALSPP